MPEFILNTAGSGQPWESLDDFTKGFIEACFFTSESSYSAKQFFSKAIQAAISEGTIDGSIPKGSSPANIDRDSFCRIKDFCDAFQIKAAAVLSEAYSRDYDESQGGRDLYFTYSGSGVGYWDRSELKSNDSDLAEYERLTNLMIENKADSIAWGNYLRARQEIESRSIGNRLTALCGQGEINLDAYKVKGGFSLSVYIG